MRNVFFIILILFSDYNLCESQITFQYKLGAVINSMCRSFDGNYIAVGSAADPNLPNASIIVKFTDTGDTLWTRILSCSDYDILNSICETFDNKYISVGITNDTAGRTEIIKTDANGNILWNKILKKDDSGVNFGYSIQQTSDSGFIIAGIRFDAGFAAADMYLLKLNSSGDTLWTKTYGGNAVDYGSDARETRDGGYIATGITSSFGTQSVDIYLVKTDHTGNLLWSKAYRQNHNLQASKVRQTIDGGYILAGARSTFDPINYSDAFIIKTDSLGNIEWNNTYGGPEFDEAYTIELSIDSGYIVGGTLVRNGSYNQFLFKINSSGDTLWTKCYNNEQLIYSVYQAGDSGVAVAGSGSFIKTNQFGETGCFEFNPDIAITSPILQQINPATNVTPVPTIFKIISPEIQSGIYDQNLCLSLDAEKDTPKPFLKTIISPNPVSNQFTIYFKQNRILEIEFFNLLGENIYSAAANGERTIVNCEQWPEGIYIVVAIDATGNKTTKMISVMR